MAGKLIVHAPNKHMGILRFNIYLNGKKVRSIGRGEVATFEISSPTTVQANIGFYGKSQSVQVSAQGTTELRAGMDIFTWKCVLNKDGTVPLNITILKVLTILLMLAAIAVVFATCDFSGSGSNKDSCGICGGSGLVNEGFVDFKTCPVCKGSGIDLH